MSNAPNLTYAETLQYLRVGRRAFDMHLRPLLPKPVKVGTRIVWKRIDVERAWEEYAFQRNGRPEEKGGNSWADPESPASTRTEMAAGGSTSGTRVNDFATALRRLKKRKRVVSPDVVYESWFS
jgi:predicted DNA-binding transcriptional regulator AlpA